MVFYHADRNISLLMQLSKEKNLKLLGVNFKDKKKQAEIFLNESWKSL